MTERIEKVIKNLKKNNINALYCKDKSEVLKTVEGLLFEDCFISSGGSMSLIESGVWDLINKPCYNFLDRNKAGLIDKEKQEIFRQIIGIDFYFCSANALTEDGQILNVDGFSNRISAIAFGPKKVIMIVGKNKIVENLQEAFLRIKRVAAPKNCVRLGIDNPCAELGYCIALEKCDNPDFTQGCSKERRICVNYLVTAFQREKDRINVIICDEELGY